MKTNERDKREKTNSRQGTYIDKSLLIVESTYWTVEI
jgi:hypothetical protein